MVTRGFTGRQSGSEPSDWIPRDCTSSTISRCLRLKPRSKRQIIHSASGSYGRTGARRRVSKERTQMLSRTIHVDDLKCCREGGYLAGALGHRDRLRRGTPGAGNGHVLSDFRSFPK